MSNEKKIYLDNWEKLGDMIDMPVKVTGGIIALSGLASLVGVFGILICDRVGLINTEENLEFYHNLVSYGSCGGLGALVGGLLLADYKNIINNLSRVEYFGGDNQDNR